MKNVIWVFREERSGSTAFLNLLVKRLRLPVYHVSSDEALPVIQDKAIFTTHDFPLLKDLSIHDEPVLIRCTRKNKAEQYLSDLMRWWMGETVDKALNMYDREYTLREEGYAELIERFEKVEPTVITKSRLAWIHKKYADKRHFWNTYANNYPNCTVYYEDLCEGIDLPMFGLTDFKLTNDLVVKKLPDYKRRVFLNHDMLVKWTQELVEKDFG